MWKKGSRNPRQYKSSIIMQHYFSKSAFQQLGPVYWKILPNDGSHCTVIFEGKGYEEYPLLVSPLTT